MLPTVDFILLHQLAMERLPPTDQFKLDNVSIKILSPENSIFCQSDDQTRTSFIQSSTVLHCHKDVSCSIRRGIQCGSRVEKNEKEEEEEEKKQEEEEDGSKCVYLHLESTHLGNRNSISTKQFRKIDFLKKTQ